MEEVGLHDTARVDAGAVAEAEQGLSPDDPINIQYTSGTTGFPKGVTLTHRNVLNNGFHIGELLGYTEEDTVVIPVPFFHCFGMVIGVIATVSHGSLAVIPARSFEPVSALRAVAATGATSLYGVPAMFIAMLARPEADELDSEALESEEDESEEASSPPPQADSVSPAARTRPRGARRRCLFSGNWRAMGCLSMRSCLSSPARAP